MENYYSKIIYDNSKNIGIIKMILNDLRKGTKIYLFLNGDFHRYIEDIEEMDKKFLVFAVDKKFLQVNDNLNLDKKYEIGIIACDKEIFDEEFYSQVCCIKNSNFNNKQYEIIHDNIDVNTIVRAGAGTGKTTTMIERVLFIKHKYKELKLKDIILITFTNKACINMKKKLVEKIQNYYKLTKNSLYLNWLDEIMQMKILTIHKFAKELLKNNFEELEMPSNFNVTTLEYKRKKLYEEYIHKFRKNNYDVYKNFINIPQYEIISFINEFQEKFNNYSIDINNKLEQVIGSDEYGFNKMLYYVLNNVNNELEIIKADNAAYEVKDLMIKLEKLNFQLETDMKFRYVIVDEFQDSDDVQINFFKTLIKFLKCNFFVVGDEKQSIYRFRGAEYTAFNKLKENLEKYTTNILKEYTMTRNYRTDSQLIKKINRTFIKANERVECFNYKESDYIYSSININEYENLEFHDFSTSISISNLLRDILNSKKKEESVVILVRSNNQLEKVKEICRYNKIPCDIETSGNFYRNEAVREFYILINVLIREDNKWNYPFINSSYYNGNIDKSEILDRISHDDDRMSIYLKGILENSNINLYRERIKYESHIRLIEEIISQLRPEIIYYKKMCREFKEIKNGNQIAKMKAIEYKINLMHCIFLIKQAFTDNDASLSKIEKYLRIQIETNSTENEKKIQEQNNNLMIKCMTVHKAKGLEFDRVIIPFTKHSFTVNNSEIDLIISRYFRSKIGYKFKLSNSLEIKNDFYELLKEKEKEEKIGEEIRLLYVAMTRAKHKVYFHRDKIYDNSCKYNNWMNVVIGG